MNNEDRELTLGQLFKVVRKSWKRAVIYVIVSVIVVSAILFATKIFTNTNTYSARVTFSEVTASTGTEISLNKNAMLNKALTKNNKELSSSNLLIKNLSISPYIPKDSTEDYVPTSFDIVLKPTTKLGFTTSEYKEILQAVAEECVNLFSANAFSTLNTSYNFPQESGKEEYFQTADELYDNVSLFYNSLSNYLKRNGELAKYNKGEANLILSRLETLKNAIDNFKNEIVINRYEKNAGHLQKTLEILLNNAQNKLTASNALLTTEKETLANFPESAYIVNGTSGTLVDQKTYEAYLIIVNNINGYAEEVRVYTEKTNNIQNYLNVIGAPATTDGAYVYNELKALNDNLQGVYADYKTLAENYNANQYLTSFATVSAYAKSTSDGLISTTIFVLLDVLVAVIAYICAYAKTFGIMKKDGSLYSDADTSRKINDELKF